MRLDLRAAPRRHQLQSFEAFVDREYPRLLRFAVGLEGRIDDGEDLTQETMARLLERWPRVATMDRPDVYAYRIVLNLHRNRRRHLAIRLRHVRSTRPDDETYEPHALTEVLDALRRLPLPQRRALLTVAWLGFTSQEAASLLGVRPSSVRSQVTRARQALMNELGGTDA